MAAIEGHFSAILYFPPRLSHYGYGRTFAKVLLNSSCSTNVLRPSVASSFYFCGMHAQSIQTWVMSGLSRRIVFSFFSLVQSGSMCQCLTQRWLTAAFVLAAPDRTSASVMKMRTNLP
ncbi:unnamed protein product [Prorocentrum cordatum]|uniref:Uncharacterized protein n=1 Tax=Prorocentrum cordatum TaxID=2364126 RepID=A0ABN9UV78_9DINO|nr:unnamed protein product [Polarella glacialis]